MLACAICLYFVTAQKAYTSIIRFARTTKTYATGKKVECYTLYFGN